MSGLKMIFHHHTKLKYAHHIRKETTLLLCIASYGHVLSSTLIEIHRKKNMHKTFCAIISLHYTINHADISYLIMFFVVAAFLHWCRWVSLIGSIHALGRH